MKNVEEWVNDKPVLLALTSLEWVYLAPGIYEYLRAFGEKEGKRKLKETFPIPPINEWIKMYENPSVIPTVIGILKNMSEFVSKLMGMQGLSGSSLPNDKDANMMEVKKQALSTPNELRAHEIIKDTKDNQWLQISKMRFDLMKGDLSGVGGGIEKIRELSALPIVVYAVMVLVPSLLLYQRNPQDLFKEARSGKLDSLAKLLVIDKEILRDETIFGFFRNASQQDKELDFNMLTKAFRQTPADLVSLKIVKVAIARFILDISKIMGHRFTIKEISDLYNKIEKDREGDDAAIDEDGLYDSEDSFYKAITRHPGYDFLSPHISDKII